MAATKTALALLALVPASALIDCTTSNSECKLGLCFQISPHATESMDVAKKSQICLNHTKDVYAASDGAASVGAHGDRTRPRAPKPSKEFEKVLKMFKNEGDNFTSGVLNDYRQELMATCSGPMPITIGDQSAQVNFFDPATMFCFQKQCKDVRTEVGDKLDQTLTAAVYALRGTGIAKFRFAGGVDWNSKIGVDARYTIEVISEDTDAAATSCNETTSQTSGSKYAAKEVCQSGMANTENVCKYPYGDAGASECGSGQTYNDAAGGRFCGCATYDDCIGPNLSLKQGEFRFDCYVGSNTVSSNNVEYYQYQCVPRMLQSTNANDVAVIVTLVDSVETTLADDRTGDFA